MTQKINVIGLGTLTVHRDYADVSTMRPTYGRDDNWAYRDDAGHVHTYDADGGTPTLTRVAEEGYHCPDCRDFHDGDSHMECAECGEEVTPGTKVIREAGTQRLLTGEEFLIDGEPVTRDEAVTWMNKAKLTLAKELKP